MILHIELSLTIKLNYLSHTLKEIIFISGNEKIANVIKTNFPNNNILISSNPTNEEMLKMVLQ